MNKTELWMKYQHNMNRTLIGKLSPEEKQYIEAKGRYATEVAYARGYRHGALCVIVAVVIAAMLFGLEIKYNWM